MKCFRPLTGISLFLLFEIEKAYLEECEESFRPLTGISLFLFLHHCFKHILFLCFRPLTGISLFLFVLVFILIVDIIVFVPSRGFLFFYKKGYCVANMLAPFSSPHGDFSFSMMIKLEKNRTYKFSSPHGDFSFSIDYVPDDTNKSGLVFVPSRGFLFFYLANRNAL